MLRLAGRERDRRRGPRDARPGAWEPSLASWAPEGAREMPGSVPGTRAPALVSPSARTYTIRPEDPTHVDQDRRARVRGEGQDRDHHAEPPRQDERLHGAHDRRLGQLA